MSKYDNSIAFSATEACVAEPACGVWDIAPLHGPRPRARAGYSPQLGSGHRAANISRRDPVMVSRFAREL